MKAIEIRDKTMASLENAVSEKFGDESVGGYVEYLILKYGCGNEKSIELSDETMSLLEKIVEVKNRSFKSLNMDVFTPSSFVELLILKYSESLSFND